MKKTIKIGGDMKVISKVAMQIHTLRMKNSYMWSMEPSLVKNMK